MSWLIRSLINRLLRNILHLDRHPWRLRRLLFGKEVPTSSNRAKYDQKHTGQNADSHGCLHPEEAVEVSELVMKERVDLGCLVDRGQVVG